jgi:NRAMP (natural resistance-associated macrophage protein)-like metal ion transporter
MAHREAVSFSSAPSSAPKPRWWQNLGPGLVTGASDDDPSGIGTFSQVGAQFGFSLLWLMLYSYPLMVAVQLICAQIGRVTGKGLAANLRQLCPRWLLLPMVLALLVANVINIGADLGAMGASAQMLAGGPTVAWTAAFGLLSLVLQVFVPYSRYVSLLKWLTLALLAYVGTVLAVKIPWATVLVHSLVPGIPPTRDGVTAVVAVLGTTISPYLFFWQASQEVEEQRAAPGEKPLRQAPGQARVQLDRMKIDTYIGMAASNVVAFFVILTAAVTLHAHGVHDVSSASQAAQALAPVAGHMAAAVFSIGIIGTGLLAVPVLAGSAAYGVAETMQWKWGLERKPASAARFYAVIAVATLAGVAMNFADINPMKALYWTSVINGVIAMPILAAVMLVASRRSVMGTLVVSGRLKLLGWTATAVMAGCAVCMWAVA